MELLLQVDSHSPTALYRQLYEDLRNGIVAGRLEGGSRLPGSRALACSLRISRTTVTECYERLASEGYLETRRRSGTFVCDKLPELTLYTSDTVSGPPQETPPELPYLSRYGTFLNAALQKPDKAGTIRLNSYGPDVSTFPKKLWASLLARRLREDNFELLQYTQHFAGSLPLREAIAAYLRKSRAAACDASQILIVNGSQQGIYLATRILVEEGDLVAMESPGYRHAGQTFASQGAEILPIPLDQDGIRVSSLVNLKGRKPKLVYVTPSHQFPTGVALSAARRVELLVWARDNGVLILEDDYDSEFRYTERPIPSMQGMMRNAPVVYVGTFSKLLFPTLRLGYLVLPPSLTNAFTAAKILSDIQSPSIDQRILTDFLEQGHLEPYVRRMRTVYGKRRAVLVQCLRKHFGSGVVIYGDNAGMHFLAEFKTKLSEAEAFERAIQNGVRLEQVFWPGSGGGTRPGYVGFVLAFAALEDSDIRLATQRLANAFLDR